MEVNKKYQDNVVTSSGSISKAEQNTQRMQYLETRGCSRPVSEFERLDRIGEGTYGVVYKARDQKTGKIVALKKVRMEREKDGIPITALREIQILKKLHHPNIVHLYEVAVGTNLESMFLVFEYVEHDLAGLIDNMKTPFRESEVKCLLHQLLRSVAYMHGKFYIHRDLKLANLLYSNRGELKLADFGLARICGQPLRPMTPKVVTLWYRAPELLLGTKDYSTAIDIWAVGCIFAELLLNEPLMPGQSEIDQLNKMCELLGSINEKIWPGFSKLPHTKSISLPRQPYNQLHKHLRRLSDEGLYLLKRMLTYDPQRRITAEEALEDRYFSSKPHMQPPDMMPTFPTKDSTGYRRRRRSAEKEEIVAQRQQQREADERFGRVFGDPHFNSGKRPRRI